MLEVKCDNCKRHIRYTDNLSESAAGGTCERCRNIIAVYTGAMWITPGADEWLFRDGLIRRNRKGWYDLTPAGRAEINV